uniref:Uncharacterized protein n=1 Tax=Sphaerodactylus townsendi TaxID=933632 RepID=A0ACB8G3E3_9SAUR
MAAADEPDAFETIVMAEARFHCEGYQEGYVEGMHAGTIEGRLYGIQQGAKISLEVGLYLGFSMMWLRLLQKHSDDKHGFAPCYMCHLISDLVRKKLHFHFEMSMNGEELFTWI